jgi:glutaminyl-peptide cyclotransferase
MRSRGRWLRERWLENVLLLGFAGIIVWFGYMLAPTIAKYWPDSFSKTFDGRAAYRDVVAQVDIGPRPTGSEGIREAQQFIVDKLTKYGGWNIEYQDFRYRGTPARNIIAKAGQGKGPVIIIGAHYDTRRRADNDPDPNKRTEPVPGANDGASGAAVLLELARSLDKYKLQNEVWLVFFDAEDNGGLDGWQFIAGSNYFANNLSIRPEAVIVVDMIGDADQQIYKEQNSTPWLVNEVWGAASRLGYDRWFLPTAKYSMLDDHTPFLQKGIPAVDIIDFDYPYWHTTEDTADKVSADSLAHVGRTLETLLEEAAIKPERSPTTQ